VLQAAFALPPAQQAPGVDGADSQALGVGREQVKSLVLQEDQPMPQMPIMFAKRNRFQGLSPPHSALDMWQANDPANVTRCARQPRHTGGGKMSPQESSHTLLPHRLDGNALVVVLQYLVECVAFQGHAVGAGLVHADAVAPAAAVEDEGPAGRLAGGHVPEHVVF